jgi:hypothetical protein
MSLGHYYQIIFGLAQHHKWSVSEIEGMMPYERDLYFEMLLAFIEKQKEAQQSRNASI